MYYEGKILTIVPETHSGELIGDYGDDDVVRASYCYLHGELEIRAGFDIFSMVKSELLPEHSDENWVAKEFPEGIYDCICFGEPCTFFRWQSSINEQLQGLVVLNTDAKAFRDAQEKYNQKAYCI